MKRCAGRISLVSAIVLALTALPGFAAEPKEPPPARTVFLKVEIGTLVDGKRVPSVSFEAVTLEREGLRVTKGNRVPIPTEPEGQGESKPPASYTYQNLGLSFQAKADFLSEKAILLETRVEISGMAGENLLKPPIVTNAAWEFTVALTSGKPVILTYQDRPSGASYISLEATIQ